MLYNMFFYLPANKKSFIFAAEKQKQSSFMP
jgi:hypothetical protein